MPSATPVRAAMRTFKTAFNTSQVRRQSTLQLRGRNNMHLFRKVGRTAAAFFPFYAFVLGWPPVLLAFNGMGPSTAPPMDIDHERIVKSENGDVMLEEDAAGC